MLEINSIKKWVKLALMVHTLQNMQNLVISCCRVAEDGFLFTEILFYNAAHCSAH